MPSKAEGSPLGKEENQHYFDDCPVCRAMKEGRTSMDDLHQAAKEAKAQGAIVGGPLFDKDIAVTVLYDKILQGITQKRSERFEIGRGLPFLLFLKLVFDAHPEIPQNFPPGELALRLNGLAPTDFQELKNKDTLDLRVPWA